METVYRIEDYLNETAPAAYVGFQGESEEMLRRAAVHCALVALDIDGETGLTPENVADLLVSHYGCHKAEPEVSAREIDLSVALKEYSLRGGITEEADLVRHDPVLMRETLAADISGIMEQVPQGANNT